ncbi:MAG TPA: hypothetical protein VHI13_12265 [Candidatus Kapabacteria bacterium]|nr:hypothetical protein [Candidatus Kapabacteria bacterium]
MNAIDDQSTLLVGLKGGALASYSTRPLLEVMVQRAETLLIALHPECLMGINRNSFEIELPAGERMGRLRINLRWFWLDDMPTVSGVPATQLTPLAAERGCTNMVLMTARSVRMMLQYLQGYGNAFTAVQGCPGILEEYGEHRDVSITSLLTVNPDTIPESRRRRRGVTV